MVQEHSAQKPFQLFGNVTSTSNCSYNSPCIIPCAGSTLSFLFEFVLGRSGSVEEDRLLVLSGGKEQKEVELHEFVLGRSGSVEEDRLLVLSGGKEQKEVELHV